MKEENDIQETPQMQAAMNIVEGKENLTDEQLRLLATDEECLSNCVLLEDVSRFLTEEHLDMPDVEEEWENFKQRSSIFAEQHEDEQTAKVAELPHRRFSPLLKYLLAAASILAAFWLIPWQKLSDDGKQMAQVEEVDAKTIFEATKQQDAVTITSAGKTYTIEEHRDQGSKLLAQLSQNEKETITITIPRGKVYSMSLPDGSQVWLNADSRLLFPSSFSGASERRVRLEGEAYFKVVKDERSPFVVEMGDSYVRVLGTEFNARNMGTEDRHVTLINGRVEVGNRQNSTVLSPGKDAQIASNGSISVKEVDVDPYIYWKQGCFYFDNASIDRILLDIGRWYNVTIKLEDQELLDYKFHFIADRNDSLSEIIEQLNQMDKVTIRRQGNTLYVR